MFERSTGTCDLEFWRRCAPCHNRTSPPSPNNRSSRAAPASACPLVSRILGDKVPDAKGSYLGCETRPLQPKAEVQNNLEDMGLLAWGIPMKDGAPGLPLALEIRTLS